MNLKIDKFASSNYIYQLYKKYLPCYLGAKDKGLFLLPTQTGSGKTHATSKIIADIIKNNKDIKIIYLINNKDEREELYKEVLEHYQGLNSEDEELFTEDIYMLESNEDNLFRAFSENNNFNYLLKLKEFKKLKRKIELLSYLKKKNEENLYSSYKEEDTALKNILKKIYKKPNDYNYDLKTVSNIIKEAKILYPTIGMNKRAIITTTQKFLNKIYDVKGSYYLFDKNKDNTIIFFDEFDTQKNVILDVFVKEVAKKGLDSFELIKIISESLHNDTINRYFLKESPIYEVKNDIDVFYEKYNLRNKIKLKTLENDKNNFFLKDSNSISISKNYNKYIFRIKRNEINIIEPVSDIKEDDVDFLKLFSEANKLIARFLGLAGSLKSNLTQEEDEIEHNEDRVYNFFYEFLTGTDIQINTILNRIFRENKKSSKRKIFQSELEKAYSNLYSILTFKDSERHESFTRFFEYTLDNTPDAFLSFLSKQFFIVGISATATIPTKIHNFNLEYLSDVLINIKDKEREELKNLYNKTKLENRKYYTNFLDSFIFTSQLEMSKELVKKDLFNEDEKLFKYIWSELNGSSYDLSRYLEFVYIFKEYCISDNMKTFLYLTTINIDDKMDLELLKVMINCMLIDNYEKIPKIKKSWFRKISGLEKKHIQNKGYELEELGIVFAKAKGDKTWKKNLKENLITKIFLVSNYTYMSKGQNLQYPYIPQGKEPERNTKYEKDFDGIYCGEITNLMSTKVDYEKSSKEEILLKLLHNTTVLQCNGEITLNEKDHFLKEIIKGKENPKNIYKNTNDYINACMIIIIQSIGRLHRTDFKGTTYMYFNHTNKEILQKFNTHNHLLLPAIEYCIKEVSKDNLIQNANINNINVQVKNRNINANISYFKALVNNPNNSKNDVLNAIREWKENRMDLVKNPTIEEDSSTEHRYFQNNSNKYWYKEKNDYKEISISNTYIAGYSEVSIENSRLKKLYSLEELKECFIENEIEIEFKYKNIMTPIVYNNFYKGAIGEIFGKYILEKFTDIELDNIDYDSIAPFETFDYTNKDETIYYDFKYFNTFTASNIQTQKALIDNVKDKLNRFKLSPKAVFIINLFVDTDTKNDFSEKIENVDNIYLVPWLIKEENSKIELDRKKIIEIGNLHDKHINK